MAHNGTAVVMWRNGVTLLARTREPGGGWDTVALLTEQLDEQDMTWPLLRITAECDGLSRALVISPLHSHVRWLQRHPSHSASR